MSGGVFRGAVWVVQGTNRRARTFIVRTKKLAKNTGQPGGLSMLYWLPRVCVLLLAGVLIAFGLIPHTAAGVANTLLIIILGLGLLSLTLHVFPPERH
ncbi:hypothetical protein BBX50_19465 [Ensifer sp. LC11]|nr:hypothetical protein BBX50_19465 [Ensifer sp. LC11]